MIYKYIKHNLPNLDIIHSHILTSSMINQELLYCNWNEKAQELSIVWNKNLSIEDKQKLDSIIGKI